MMCISKNSYNLTMRKVNRCLFCGKKSFAFVQEVDGVPYGFLLYRCKSCGTHFQNPMPKKLFLEKLYEKIYQKKYKLISTERAFEEKDEEQEKMRMEKIETFVKPGKLLDVGASTGFFLSEAKKRGWEVFGVEYAKEAVERAKRAFGLNIAAGDIETVGLPNEYFDVVTMHSVLEHIPNPIHAIQIVRKKLKRGGLFVFSLPNVGSFEFALFKLLRRQFPGFIAEHLYYSTPNGVKKMLGKNGFALLSLTSRHYATLRLPPKRPLIGIFTFFVKLFLEYTEVGGRLTFGNVLYVYAKKIG